MSFSNRNFVKYHMLYKTWDSPPSPLFKANIYKQFGKSCLKVVKSYELCIDQILLKQNFSL